MTSLKGQSARMFPFQSTKRLPREISFLTWLKSTPQLRLKREEFGGTRIPAPTYTHFVSEQNTAYRSGSYLQEFLDTLKYSNFVSIRAQSQRCLKPTNASSDHNDIKFFHAVQVEALEQLYLSLWYVKFREFLELSKRRMVGERILAFGSAADICRQLSALPSGPPLMLRFYESRALLRGTAIIYIT